MLFYNVFFVKPSLIHFVRTAKCGVHSELAARPNVHTGSLGKYPRATLGFTGTVGIVPGIGVPWHSPMEQHPSTTFLFEREEVF